MACGVTGRVDVSIDQDALAAGDEPGRQAREAFAVFADAVPRARRWVGACLDAWGLARFAGALELAVSELFTNAVRYRKGPIEVALAVRPGRVRVDVQDRGGGRPVVRLLEGGGPWWRWVGAAPG